MTHATATREEWLSARLELLAREKELTRQSDELARQRRALPWVPVDKVYDFSTNEGTKTLAELFAGRSQLLVYHFMLGPNTPEGCPGCTFFADGFDGATIHLEHHDVTFMSASRASLDTLNAYKRRMGWRFPWVSSQGSDFNRDFSAFNEKDRENGTGFNFGTPKRAELNVIKDEELMALSGFALEDGVVYHTYTCYDRGTDGLHLVWQLLDRAPKGRAEGAWKDWPRKHDEYGTASRVDAPGQTRVSDLHFASRQAAHVEHSNLPGLVTAVAARGKVRIDVIGDKTVGARGPMTRDTIFRVASLTKPIVAAATMALVDDAKLNLDEPVDRLLTELADRRVLRRFDGPIDETVPACRQITVRDLLTCRMGFGIIWGAPDAHPIQRAAEKLRLAAFGPPHPQVPPPPDEWIRRFSTLPLMYQPGERWAYNTAFEVLGVLVARASGRSLGALLEERIFQPLGMKDTGFRVPPGHLDRLATSYAANPATDSLEPYDGVQDSAWSKPPAFPSAAGGLVSTVDDLLAFGHMMLARGEHGGTRILSAASAQEMTRDQLTDQQKTASPISARPTYWQSHGWGLGLAVTIGDGAETRPGAFGWEGGLGTSWASDPRNQMVAILLTQYGASPAFAAVYPAFWKAAYAVGAE